MNFLGLVFLYLATMAQPIGHNRLETRFELPMIGLPDAVSQPRYWEIPIEICGRVVPATQSRPDLSLLYGTNLWLYVRTEGSALTGSAACVTGVILRKDGYSEAAAERLGLVRSTIIDAADDLRIFHECSSEADCASLVRNLRPQSVGRAQASSGYSGQRHSLLPP